MVNKKRDVIECNCNKKDLVIVKGTKIETTTILGENCVCVLRKVSGERIRFGSLMKDVLITDI